MAQTTDSTEEKKETCHINAEGRFVLDPFDWDGISPRDLLMKKMATVPMELVPDAQWNITVTEAITRGLVDMSLQEMKQLPPQVWLAIRTGQQPWFNLCDTLLSQGRLGALDYIETFQHYALIWMTFRTDKRRYLKCVIEELKEKEQWHMLLYLMRRIRTTHTDLFPTLDELSALINNAVPEVPAGIQALHVYSARRDPDRAAWPDDPPPTLRISSNGKLHW